MLIRFTVSNFLSFKEPTEFNMLTGTVRRLNHHVYEPAKGLALLKMAAVYGANGAGKSNLVKAISFMHNIIAKECLEPLYYRFQLDPKYRLKPSSFETEIVLNNETFLYGLDLYPGFIGEEWLYRSQPGKEDELIFHRFTNKDGTSIKANPAYSQTPEQKLRLRLYEKEILKPNVPLLRLIGDSEADFGPVKQLFHWFSKSLLLIFPQSKSGGTILDMVQDQGFCDFATETMCSLHTGIKKLVMETTDLDVFFGREDSKDIQEIKSKFAEADARGENLLLEHAAGADHILILLENGRLVVKRLLAVHEGADVNTPSFMLWQESDGTNRLLDLLPAFYRAIHEDVLIVIDEIEHSIHPVLLKELVSKFACEHQTKGQLIFTTHEAHLLDQEFMRSDEFWFAEKGPDGATALSPLSDFKDIRFDLDLRKGYLLGRFGAIPFTGDLRQLQWASHAEAEHE